MVNTAVKINVNGQEVELPEGWTLDRYLKLTGTFMSSAVQGKKRDQAVQEATKALRKKYSSEYKTLLNTELKKAGLPVKS